MQNISISVHGFTDMRENRCNKTHRDRQKKSRKRQEKRDTDIYKKRTVLNGAIY